MFKNEDIKDVYTEDTRGRRYHTPIVSKPKDRTEEPPGEVHTMYLNKPMLWPEFKALPDDLKRMYIKHLIATYNITQKDIYTMLGCSLSHFHRCLVALNLIGTFPGRSAKQTKAQRKAWIAFLSDRPNPDVTPKTETKPETKPEIKPEIKSSIKPETKIQNFSFTQSGPFNLEEFINRITTFIQEGDDCTIAINTSKNSRPIYAEGNWGEN